MRTRLMEKYYKLKSKRELSEYVDYDPSFLRRLNDNELEYLVSFLESYYTANRYSRGSDAQIDAKTEDIEGIYEPHEEDKKASYFLRFSL
jgi:hypothetical protein